MATKIAVLPSAVGVDIGCGMVAAETNLTAAELPDSLNQLHRLLRDRVSAGVGKGHERGEGNRALGIARAGTSDGIGV